MRYLNLLCAFIWFADLIVLFVEPNSNYINNVNTGIAFGLLVLFFLERALKEE